MISATTDANYELSQVKYNGADSNLNSYGYGTLFTSL